MDATLPDSIKRTLVVFGRLLSEAMNLDAADMFELERDEGRHRTKSTMNHVIDAYK